MSRARLAAMLWPQTTQAQSQANLRKGFWRLHRALPGHPLVIGVGRGEQGDYGLALEVALCALRTDSLRERAHRAVINVHRAEGNAEEARRAFATCNAVLTREIGVAPSAATAALVP